MSEEESSEDRLFDIVYEKELIPNEIPGAVQNEVTHKRCICHCTATIQLIVICIPLVLMIIFLPIVILTPLHNRTNALER